MDVISVLEFWVSLGTVSVLICLFPVVPKRHSGRRENGNAGMRRAAPSFRSARDWRLNNICMYVPNVKRPRFVFLLKHFDVVFLDSLIAYSESVFSQMMH